MKHFASVICILCGKEKPVKTAEEVVKAYENLLYRAALTITGNREDALDMVQETLIRWITKRPEFASDEHEKAWLLRVVMNLSETWCARRHTAFPASCWIFIRQRIRKKKD